MANPAPADRAARSETARGAVALEEMRGLLVRGQRLLGLDLGTKTIGLALSDVEYRIASAFYTIRRRKFRDDAGELIGFAKEFSLVGLVIGLPTNMDGSAGPRVQATKAFVRNLMPILPLPVLLWDERLSTAAAERMLIAADLSRRKRANVIDQTAAAYILQGALDALGYEPD